MLLSFYYVAVDPLRSLSGPWAYWAVALAFVLLATATPTRIRGDRRIQSLWLFAAVAAVTPYIVSVFCQVWWALECWLF